MAEAMVVRKEKNIYVFLGENGFLREDEQDKVISRCVSGADDSVSVIEIDGSDASFHDIETAVLSRGMFSDRRIVRIRRVDKMSVEDQNRLANSLADLPDDTVLLLSAVKLDGRGRLMKALRSCGIVKEFKNLYQRDAVSWCRDRAKYHKLKLGPREAELLVELVGTDLVRLDHELEKLSLYLERSVSTVDSSTIARIAGSGGEAAVFDLLDAIGERDSVRAVRFLRQILRSGEHPVKLHFIIARHVRDLLRVASMRESGMRRDAIIAALGIHPYRAGKLIAHSSNFERSELESSLSHVLTSDLRIKSSELTPECWLELTVHRVCGQASRN